MNLIFDILTIVIIVILGKSTLVPLINQFKLQKAKDSLTIYSITPNTILSIVLIFGIIFYATTVYAKFNFLIVFVVAVFIFLLLGTAIISSRIVLGDKQMAFMYKSIFLKDISKIKISKASEEKFNVLVTLKVGYQYTFKLNKLKKDLFKTYMSKQGSKSTEK